MARIYHADLWGIRDGKYEWLNAHDMQTTDWREITPKSKFYLFVPRDDTALELYEKFAQVTQVFPIGCTGIKTHRDRFVIHFDREPLKRRIRQFRDRNMPDDLLRQAYKLKDKKGWTLAQARKTMREDDAWEQRLTHCLYRPFDRRWLIYHPALIERGREEVMRHMLAGENMALLVSRQVVRDFRHAFVSDKITSFNNIDVAGRFGSGYQLPLYLYPDAESENLFAHHDASERRANLNPAVVEALAAAYGEAPTPEEIFNYVYAVLYAPTYRERYAEFLRIDFPRIPFTADREVFEELAALGGRLVALHLLKSPELDPPAARFESEPPSRNGASAATQDNRVAKTKGQGFRYDPEQERVWINKAQYFAPVTPEVWEYRIGGYQVCEKWLKDRRNVAWTWRRSAPTAAS